MVAQTWITKKKTEQPAVVRADQEIYREENTGLQTLPDSQIEVFFCTSSVLAFCCGSSGVAGTQ